MASDTAETETLLQGSIIAVSDTPSSTDESPATKALKKTARDQFYTDIKMTNETKSWEATCKICKSKIRGTKGVTSNYNRHAKDFHPSEYESWQEQLQSISLTVELQKSIVENLIIELGLPLSLIERSGFITFMSNVDPKFSTISRRTLTRTILPDLYTKMLHGLKSFCSMATFISLTLDLWTDRRQRVFFALTGHSIINSEFKSYVLSFQPIYGKHRGPVLLDTYEACISSFSIRGKLVRLITDSASNNIAAFSGLIIPGFECYFQRDDDDELYSDWYNDGEQTESDDAKIDNNVPLDVQDVVKQFLDSIAIDDESFRLPCYAHSIQLVINDGLKGSICVQPSLEKISKIAKLSHSSTAVAERLENIQVCVPNANKTRWNSQYDMVVTVIGIQPSALNDILIQTQHRELCLKSLDYQMLNEFVSLLTLFAEATTTTQAQKTPSVSIVAPSILAIYQDLLLERANVKHASSLCECLLESLLSRFGGMLEQMLLVIDISEKKKKKNFYDLFKDPVFLVAPFLDGRFRLNWISKQCILIEQVNAPLGTTENDNSILSPTAQTQPLSASAATSPITPKRKYLFANIVKETKNLNDMVLLKPSNIYPTLSKLAMKFLSIPATSAPVERVFSQSGFLFRQHRASMTRTTLQQLTMLKCNRGLY
ncbi:unnamed protein product [Rotaria socialis]|uniref:HAT C-terminal dimerisation domain-containing protein n=3 Tax=Rotaria socialis TaxID=392032 RepID=A0A820MYJ3_9BILA|nr:unnamed protein product [Rotaria socialis]CAF4381971.1 unnamed protein product [Rotaria socialis]